MGEVVALPLPVVRQPSCFICKHALVGDQTRCRIFDETILNERSAAEECEHFDDDPHKE